MTVPVVEWQLEVPDPVRLEAGAATEPPLDLSAEIVADSGGATRIDQVLVAGVQRDAPLLV